MKDYLRDKNISFEEKNVGEDRAAAMEMIRKSGQQGVPVLDINGNLIVGFDKQGIDKLIGI